jgi:hypothetical protein
VVDGGRRRHDVQHRGGHTLAGTAGQPDAGLLTGDGYALGGGFWRGGPAAPPEYELYLPLVVRNR